MNKRQKIRFFSQYVLGAFTENTIGAMRNLGELIKQEPKRVIATVAAGGFGLMLGSSAVAAPFQHYRAVPPTPASAWVEKLPQAYLDKPPLMLSHDSLEQIGKERLKQRRNSPNLVSGEGLPDLEQLSKDPTYQHAFQKGETVWNLLKAMDPSVPDTTLAQQINYLADLATEQTGNPRPQVDNRSVEMGKTVPVVTSQPDGIRYDLVLADIDKLPYTLQDLDDTGLFTERQLQGLTSGYFAQSGEGNYTLDLDDMSDQVNNLVEWVERLYQNDQEQEVTNTAQDTRMDDLQDQIEVNTENIRHNTVIGEGNQRVIGNLAHTINDLIKKGKQQAAVQPATYIGGHAGTDGAFGYAGLHIGHDDGFGVRLSGGVLPEETKTVTYDQHNAEGELTNRTLERTTRSGIAGRLLLTLKQKLFGPFSGKMGVGGEVRQVEDLMDVYQQGRDSQGNWRPAKAIREPSETTTTYGAGVLSLGAGFNLSDHWSVEADYTRAMGDFRPSNEVGLGINYHFGGDAE